MPSYGLGLSTAFLKAGSGSGTAAPSLPSGLAAAWAALPDQYTTSGSTVTGMTDITGNGHNITAFPAAPVVTTLLGDTWFDFTGSKYATIPSSLSVAARDCGVFVVLNQGTGTTGSARAVSLADGGSMGVGYGSASMPGGEINRGTNTSATAPNRIWTGFGWQLSGRVNTATDSKYWLDLEVGTGTAVAASTLVGGEIGHTSLTPSVYFPGFIKAAFVFSPAPNSTQLTELRNYCQYYFRVGSTVMDSVVVVDGDSITAGGVNGAQPWAFFMGGAATVGQDNIRPKFRNYATGGHTIAQVVSGLSNPTAWLADQTNYTRKIYICMAGINSIGTVSEADMKTQLTSIVTTMQAAGAEVTLLTILPAVGISDETKRQNVNSWLVAGSSGADNVVDLRNVTGLTDPSDTTYFSDGVHPTSAGEKIIGDTVFAQLFPA